MDDLGVLVLVGVPVVLVGVPMQVDEVGGKQQGPVRENLLGSAGRENSPVLPDHEDSPGDFRDDVQVIRITSYNVCYTKLLRDFVRGAVLDDSVLVNARGVREGVRPHDRLVPLDGEPHEGRDHLACLHDLLRVDPCAEISEDLLV